MKRLECKFGIVGQPLQWIKSYLTGRSFSGKYQSEMSSTVKLACSVPGNNVRVWITLSIQQAVYMHWRTTKGGLLSYYDAVSLLKLTILLLAVLKLLNILGKIKNIVIAIQLIDVFTPSCR